MLPIRATFGYLKIIESKGLVDINVIWITIDQ